MDFIIKHEKAWLSVIIGSHLPDLYDSDQPVNRTGKKFLQFFALSRDKSDVTEGKRGRWKFFFTFHKQSIFFVTTKSIGRITRGDRSNNPTGGSNGGQSSPYDDDDD